MPRALLSVSDKTGLIPFAQVAGRHGVRARVDRRHRARARERPACRSPASRQVTGFPEIMDGRVKTLHPAVHGGILARRGRSDDMATLGQHNITPIDIVVVNLYPFVKAAATPDIAFGALVEEIDIGGPSMVRSAAKNFQDVLVVVDPADYRARARRARAAGWAVDASSASISPGRRLRTPRPTTPRSPERSRNSRAAEGSVTRDRPDIGHPAAAVAHAPQDQRAALRRKSASAGGVVRHRQRFGLGSAQVLQGKELSFTNLLDLDSAARIALEFTEPAAAVIKHTNPCGAAIGAHDRRGVRSRARGRSARGLRRHHRAQPPDRRGDGAGARVDLHRSGDRPGRRGRGAADSRGQSEHARRRGRSDAPVMTAASRRDVRSILGAVLVQQRDEVIEARSPWSAQTVAAAGLEGRDEARAERGGMGRASFRMAHLRARQVECRHLYRRVAHAGHRRGPDEPRRCCAGRGDEGDGLRRKEPAGRIGRRVGRIFSVSRRIGRARESGRHGRRSARRIVARQRSDCGRRRTRHCDGVHGQAALQALTR